MNPSPLLSFRSLQVLAVALATGCSCCTTASAVDFPAPSPAAVVKQRVGLTDIEINYSRPSMKGRQIFGGLVPYDKVWRTGANSSTKITFSTPAKFGGKDVPAGTYAFYTIPGQKEWTLILSKKTDLWGSFGYEEKDDFVRVTAAPQKLATPVETMTIAIDDITDESAKLVVAWDTVRVPVTIEVDYAEQLVQEIKSTMSSNEPRKPYHQAAQFYFDHNQDLSIAREWINAAVAENPNAYWSLHLQARILAKLGDKAGATAAAKKSIELASKNGDTGYVKSNQDLLASLN